MVEVNAREDDPINAKHRSRMRDERCMMLSGVWFYLYDPKPDEIRHVDIEAGLAHTCRFRGQLPRFLSVLEHSIKVAAVTEHIVTNMVQEGEVSADVIPVASLYAILHDAHEAYTGDIPRPWKERLGDAFGTPWERIESRLQDAIHEAYGLPPLPIGIEEVIRDADDWVLYCEATVLKPKLAEDIRKIPPPDVLSIARVRKDEPNRKAVRESFTGEVARLVQIVGGLMPSDPTAVVEPEPTPSREVAVEGFAAAVEAVGIPPQPLNPPPPPEVQEVRTLDLTRAPRGDDVDDTTWANAVRSSKVEMPGLMDEIGEDDGS